ncbi:hypothetical protein B0T22DRAFT_437703 [Podospora appendiculata]|uniref:Nascent polypeptide-associated complex subunit alpha-like UBA domain-containing protein n=1 Tax=Podospora appendiculata TaxID=314037 RepID=A0AAE0XJU0_9PEZI|nr:hypothetical protein B0T22DRAFT_437703 [Podospora appendiculata]
MAEDKQPQNVVEGATTGGDVDDEEPATAKSAEDRKAANALQKLNDRDDEASSSGVNQEAVNNAMDALSGDVKGKGKAVDTNEDKITVAPEDVKFIESELELKKSEAIDLLRKSKGDVVEAVATYVS